VSLRPVGNELAAVDREIPSVKSSVATSLPREPAAQTIAHMAMPHGGFAKGVTMFTKLRRRLRRPSPGTALGFIALAVVLGGVASAAIPAADGKIKACYAKTGGLLTSKGDVRLVDENEACRSSETAISWNQKGPKGDPCLPSDPACIGPKGDKGDKGDKGEPCAPSDPACVGPPGEKGDKGDPCLSSDPACVGPTGPKGAAGISTVTFAGTPAPVELGVFPGQVLSKRLPPGSWAIDAVINTSGVLGRPDQPGGDIFATLQCELRNGSDHIGYANDSRYFFPRGVRTYRAVSINGGAQIPEGGREVSVWCRSNMGDEWVDRAQVMMMQIGGFS
jgi:hypothetical protein